MERITLKHLEHMRGLIARETGVYLHIEKGSRVNGNSWTLMHTGHVYVRGLTARELWLGMNGLLEGVKLMRDPMVKS